MSLREALQAAGIEAEQGSSTSLFDGRAPGVVARPNSTEQVSRTMRIATEQDAVVAVRGAGTKLSWGGVGAHLDLVVDLSGMNQVLEHQPGDLIASAQAGCPLSAVQARCAEAGQRLALDEMVPGTTVGGLIATNPSGPLRLLAGTVRDLLIAVTLVLADGTIAHAGGKVVKNVAGYDLGKLLVGSYGTLAVITEATFRLHPEPKASAWVLATHPRAEVPAVLADLLHSQDAPSAIEIRSARGESVELAALLEGTPDGVRQRAGRLGALIAGGTGEQPDWTGGYPWQIGSGVGLKVTCQLSAVPGVLEAAAELGWTVQGSAGTGVLYAAPGADAQVDAQVDAATLESAARTLRAAAVGGSVIVLDAPRQLRAEVDLWGPVPALEVMRRVKDQFDPENRLAPGRFVGGI